MNGQRKRDAALVIEHRIHAYGQQRGLCMWCGVPMLRWRADIRANPNRRVTADHLIPSADGGPHERWNIVAACYRCNHRRSSRSIDHWVSMLRQELTEEHYAILLARLTRFGIKLSVGQPALAAPTADKT